MNLKKIFYSGILLVGSAAALFSAGCASTQSSSIDKIVLDSLNPRNAVMEQEKQPGKTGKQYLNESLDKLIRLEIDYQKPQRQKILHGKTDISIYSENGDWFFDIQDNTLLSLTSNEADELKDVLNLIKTSTYDEFVNELAQLNEKQITVALSSLARFILNRSYQENQHDSGDSKADAEQMYNIIKNALDIIPEGVKEDIACRQIHNFVSETARRADLPEAITFSCEEDHVASAVWWKNGRIIIIDYDYIYAGNSDLELVLREYQRIRRIPAFSHEIHRKNHLFTFITVDGRVFYHAINHPKDTTQLKGVLKKQDSKKHALAVRLGSTENSFQYNSGEFFGKFGHIKGPEGLPWESLIFQVGLKDSTKDLKYNLNFLIVPIKGHNIACISANIIQKKDVDIGSSDNLTIAGQLTSLMDLRTFPKEGALLNENDLLALGMGVNYTHVFDENTKADIYSVTRIEPVHYNIISKEVRPIISEARAGCRLTSENTFINPEFLYERQSDTLSLETGWHHKDLELGFTLSTSNTRYKHIWPDKKSLRFSAKYTPTNDLSIGGSAEYSQKKWPSDERYDFKVNLWVKKAF